MIRALCLVTALAAPLPLSAQDLTPPEAGTYRVDIGHTELCTLHSFLCLHHR